MEFILFLSFNDVSFGDYGPIISNPEIDTRVECYKLENGWDDVDLFDEDINSINKKCNSLLDYGDIEFFDSEKCVLLESWIINRLAQPASLRYHELLEILRDYCHRASELKTGVYIDL